MQVSRPVCSRALPFACVFLVHCSGDAGAPSLPASTPGQAGAAGVGMAGSPNVVPAAGGSSGGSSINPTGSTAGNPGGAAGAGGLDQAGAGGAGTTVSCDSAALAAAANHHLGPEAALILPIKEVLGGTGASNNAKSHPGGGYFSHFDHIDQFKYPDTHGNQLGDTALVNDHIYWDSVDGGLQATHVPPPDAGGGSVLFWPAPGEWLSFAINVTAPDTYTVMTRFSSGWGPDSPVLVHVTIDGVEGEPLTLSPDDPKIWADPYYQVGGWWGHTMTNFTAPKAWALSAGCHVLKYSVDRFPQVEPPGNGWVWIHYLKLAKGGL